MPELDGHANPFDQPGYEDMVAGTGRLLDVLHDGTAHDEYAGMNRIHAVLSASAAWSHCFEAVGRDMEIAGVSHSEWQSAACTAMEEAGLLGQMRVNEPITVEDFNVER